MRATVEPAWVITVVLSQEDARAILDDWDTSKEPSRAGKVLYSALVEVANPQPPSLPSLTFPPGARAGGGAYEREVTTTNAD